MARIYDATWGRAFATLYDRSLKSAEEAGLHRMREELLAGASGRTLEIGAGTGINLDLYPDTVDDLTLDEPGPHMATRLRAKVAESGRRATVADAPADRLPYPDSTFDTAVATLVFCTIPQPLAAVAEVERVLKPGGRLLFLEHVRADDPKLARWQDRLERPWRFLADGCHPNRDTLATIAATGLQVTEVTRDTLPRSPPIVRPLIRGSAELPA